MYTRRMLVDGHLEAGTSVPQVRIKIDVQIILRHHLDLTGAMARNDAISRLPSAVLTMGRGFCVAQHSQLARPLVNHFGWELTGQPCRRRIGPHGEGENVE